MAQTTAGRGHANSLKTLHGRAQRTQYLVYNYARFTPSARAFHSIASRAPFPRKLYQEIKITCTSSDMSNHLSRQGCLCCTPSQMQQDQRFNIICIAEYVSQVTRNDIAGWIYACPVPCIQLARCLSSTRMYIIARSKPCSLITESLV